MKTPEDRREKGSLLIFTVWVLVVLSIFTLSVGYQVRQRLRLVQRLEIRAKLRQVADAGVRKAIDVVKHGQFSVDSYKNRWSHSPSDFKDIPVGDGIFNVRYRSLWDDKIRYGVVDEESKIHINRTQSPKVLKDLFRYAAGLGSEEAHDIAVSILDWRDEDEFLYEGGAESRYYRSLLKRPYASKNADLDTLEELLFIKGITPDIFQRIYPYVTVDGDEVVNINTASSVVLMAHGFSRGLVRHLNRYRKGTDQIMGTNDDRIFLDLASIPDQIAMVSPVNKDEKKALESFVHSGVFGVHSNHFTASSQSRLRHRKETLTVTCVFARNGKILRCQEQFGVLD